MKNGNNTGVESKAPELHGASSPCRRLVGDGNLWVYFSSSGHQCKTFSGSSAFEEMLRITDNFVRDACIICPCDF